MLSCTVAEWQHKALHGIWGKHLYCCPISFSLSSALHAQAAATVAVHHAVLTNSVCVYVM